MERSQKTHRPSDLHSGRVQPLFTGSPPQSARVSRESIVSSSLARSVQDRGRAHRARGKRKDQDNAGIGQRLLNMMRKTLMESENKERDAAREKAALIPFGDVVGCLAVHIKNCRQFLPFICLKHYKNLYIRISVNNFVKYTKSFNLLSGNSDKNIVIKFDEMKFFSIQVPRHQDDTWNNISLELVQYSDTDDYLLLLGSATVHLYEVIQKMCFTEELQMLNENTCVCRLDVEFMFAYGSFGYGFSHQLKPLQRNIEPTMFLSVASQPKPKDLPVNGVTPQPDTVGNSAEGQPPTQQLEKPRERLEKMKKEYKNLNTWKEKADYLESLLNPELEPKNSKETDINKIPESLNNNQDEKKPEETITLCFIVKAVQRLILCCETESGFSVRLEKMKKEYKNLNTWKEKADYLESLLNPELEPKNSKETDINKIPESLNNNQDEKKPEETITLYLPHRRSKAEPPPTELLEDDKKVLTVPTLKLEDTDNSNAVAPRTEESAPPPTDIPLFVVPTLKVTEEEKLPPLDEQQPRATLEDKMKNMLLPPVVRLRNTYPSILKSDGSAPKIPKFISKASFDPFLRTVYNKIPARSSKEQDPYKNRNILLAEDIEYEDQDPPYAAGSKTAGYNSNTWASDPTNVITKMMSDIKNIPLRSNEDETSPTEVGFPSKDQKSVHFKREFKPKYQIPDFTDQASSDPFLRPIDNIIPARSRKEQDRYKNRNILFAEDIEYEEQDPPYAAGSKIAGPTITTKASNPITIAKTISDTKSKFPCDPAINTTNILGSWDKLVRDADITMRPPHPTFKEKLPSASLPSFIGQSPMMRPENECHLSKSLNPPSHMEKLKLGTLKSILSKSLQSLSDTLFCRSDICKNTEAIEKSSSPRPSIHKKSSQSLEDEVFKGVQDLSTWLSEKHMLNSKALLCDAIKNISADLVSEGKPGKSLEGSSEKHLEAGETNLPAKTKSSSKKKHLICAIPSSKSGLHGDVHDCFIKEIFTAPIFSQLEAEMKKLSKTQMKRQERSLSSKSLVPSGEKEEVKESPWPSSVINQIMQAFPMDAVLDSGVSKLIELGREDQMPLPPHRKRASAEEAPEGSTVDYSDGKSKTKLPSGQKRPVGGSQTTSLGDSTLHNKADVISKGQRLRGGESVLNSALKRLSNPLLDTFNESKAMMLTSPLKNVFNAFFKPDQSERRRRSEELETLTAHSYPGDTEHLEIQGNFNKADKRPFLSPKLRVFLEELSESEIKGLKLELSKYIQHYLIEKLSDIGYITKEDLPRIYQNLYLMNEKVKRKGQNIFQDKYSETLKEVMAFINNLKNHFIDKYLEIKLRSFLNEILQNYLLKYYLDSSLLNKTESAPTVHSNASPIRAKHTSKSFYESEQDISRENFGRRLDINMKYPLEKSLQNYLITLSETELLNLKENLSKHIQRTFIEKLLKSGLITEKQLKGINQHINLVNSSSSPSKYIKTDLPFRDDNGFMADHSGQQNECSKTGQSTASQNITEGERIETGFNRKEQKEYFSVHNSRENAPTLQQQKNYYSREGSKTRSLIKTQPYSDNIRAISLNRSSERLTNILLKKHKKEYGFLQAPQTEISMYKTETQDSYSRDGNSETILSKACFEATLKAKPIEKREYINTYSMTLQRKPEAILSPFPRIPYCCIPRDSEDYLNSSTFPLGQAYTSTHFDFETKKQETFDQYFRRLKANNNNNKKHLITFGQYRKDIQTLYTSPSEICDENCADFPESRSFKYKENEKNSKSFFFPEVLKRENIKPKVQKERKHGKFRKSSNNRDRILPTTLPTTTIHVRKSIPKTSLHWTARTTIHDCLDKYEDVYATPVKHPTKTKSRARLAGKNPDCSHHRGRHAARPYTAPGSNKRESYSGKFPSPRMGSAGLIHINDATLDHTMHKMLPPQIKRRY
ncbi:PREDICTED: amyotrophic lateral sclerosis 2 chromosomal region candidate gene 11 protein [Chinchilla lanigera]|uniref:amyotrophic lateral sclerosis 2 chromosomal region candidate gene 11 protein n=1 Tax=Chinchilla lanigera TaxID=34839 RepID=UPI000696B1E7|nr:PREDICTED: amyotrophic lateral sclerosis 2 chromosomal region candidate gene 11 protein [Chinchilla lanigera]